MENLPLLCIFAKASFEENILFCAKMSEFAGRNASPERV
jgi:hypothetical protein